MGLDAGMPSFTDDGGATANAMTAQGDGPGLAGEDQPSLPDQVASVPMSSPETPSPITTAAVSQDAGAQTPATTTPQDPTVSVSADEVLAPAPVVQAQAAEPPRKTGLFSRMFKTSPANAAPAPQPAPADASPAATQDVASVAVDAAAEAPAEAPAPQARPETPAPVVADAVSASDEETEIAAAAPMQPASLMPAAPKKAGLFGSMFAGSGDGAQPKRTMMSGRGDSSSPARRAVDDTPPRPLVAESTGRPVIETANAGRYIESTPSKPLIGQAATETNRKPVVLASYGNDNGLPGVRQSALFEISRKSGLDDDSDVDLHEEELYSAPVRVASAAGLARLAPNGLLTQAEHVDVTCLKPSLVRVLKSIEQRFGKKLVVTSGYRSNNYNRKVRGAKNSLHMYCAAADIQVPGITKWELANFVRAMPGRGGVGTYCHTDSVHVDVGPERDWNWRCRRRK
jgi:uncharacterized protein YcbK (DUF882 family)